MRDDKQDWGLSCRRVISTPNKTVASAAKEAEEEPWRRGSSRRTGCLMGAGRGSRRCSRRNAAPGGADGDPGRAADGHPLGVLVRRDGVGERDAVLLEEPARRRAHQLQAAKGDDDRHLPLARRQRRVIARVARCGVEPEHRRGRSRGWLPDALLAALQLACVSSANHVQLSTTVGPDRRGLC